jgi:hypothetical protein
MGWTTGLVASAGATLLSPVVDQLVNGAADLAQLVQEGVIQVVRSPRDTRTEAALRVIGAASNRLLHT